MYHSCQAQVVSGKFYSAVAKRRKPNFYVNDRVFAIYQF